MSEHPDTDEQLLTRHDPAESLTPAHKALITMLAEIAVTDYLAKEGHHDLRGLRP